MNLSSIYVYPIKACRGLLVDHVTFDEYGIEGDRRFLIVDSEGVAMTQRDFHTLTFVEPQADGEVLSLSAPGMNKVQIDVSHNHFRQKVQVWDDRCDAEDCGDEAAEWFSEYLKLRCRLVKMAHGFTRLIDRNYSSLDEHVSFADAYPALIISEASLADLNSKLEEKITMKRFRPNFVVEGCEPFAEDSWKKIQIGSMTFRAVKLCARCVVPTINLETGVPGKEPLRTLATYRTINGKVMFGQNIIHDQKSGSVRAGDTVTVIQ
ncbi:MOSC domain-containing protein [bacterium]|nr:MOSC domain-containing protein [bacterium]